MNPLHVPTFNFLNMNCRIILSASSIQILRLKFRL